MWEFSLFFPDELLNYFCDFEAELKKLCQNEKCCIRIVKNGQYALLLALPTKIYEQNVAIIKEKIVQAILLYYKPKIIIQTIKDFSIKDQNNKMLIDILANFDVSSDKKEIFSRLSLCGKMYLDSFVYFKLWPILETWREMARLINQNSLFLGDAGVKTDLMRFLMSGIASQALDVSLDYANGKIKILQNGKELPSIASIFYANDIYDNLLFMLISKSPKKITISNYRQFDASFVNSVFRLFGDTVKLIE